MALMEALKTEFSTLKPSIERDLAAYAASLKGPNSLCEAMRYALGHSAGRMRPACARLIANALGQSGAADNASLAVEFFHTASLLADDLPCMDNDTLRRGLPTTHLVYGESCALLASYGWIAEGYSCLAKAAHGLKNGAAERLIKAIEETSAATGTEGASGGQWLDLSIKTPSLQEIQEIFEKKTATLFHLSFTIGWLFGEGDLAALPALQRAARHFGLIFQLADDLEDAHFSPKKEASLNSVHLLGEAQVRHHVRLELEALQLILKEIDCELFRPEQFTLWETAL